MLIIVVILSLAGLTAPMVIRCPKKASQTEATSNLRQVGIALLEFDHDYGSFPNDETSKTVTGNFPDHGLNLTGKSSNALFRQLFAAGLTQSEIMFYAEVNGTRKSDGDISPAKFSIKEKSDSATSLAFPPKGIPRDRSLSARSSPAPTVSTPNPSKAKRSFSASTTP